MLRKFLDCSTGNVSQETANWLDEQAQLAALYQEGSGQDSPALSIKGDCYGWFVHVSEEDAPDWPVDLCVVFAHARKLDCDYVLFDRDAEACAGLPAFDW